MKNRFMMIKPASGNCNLRCEYCFYCDEMEHRKGPSCGCMDEETMRAVIRASLSGDVDGCTFGFQGGEPTLWGLPRFRDFVNCVEAQNERKIPVQYFLQTNGCTLDREWAEFFRANQFLIGVSVDGTIHTHDRYRKTRDGQGTYVRAMEGIQCLREVGVPFNVLTVVHSGVAVAAEKVYKTLRKQGFSYLQFIPCLDALDGERRGYSLTAEGYGRFLCSVFDLWYQEWESGTQVSVRQFENYVDMLCGYEPESCDMRGCCGINYVVEVDGSVYPCDFYALDEWRLGNLREDTLEQIDAARAASGFTNGRPLPEACRACKWLMLCRNGCRRHLQGRENRFCRSYQMFFEHAIERLERVAGNRK